MTALPHTQVLHKVGTWSDAEDHVLLTYEARFFRRRKLTSAGGIGFVADFAQTVSLDHGDALELPDGRRIEVRAAPEAVLRVSGPDLPRLAWHIGNRHTPCQIAADHVVIQNDPVIRHMLDHLGAEIAEMTAPFTPEGGAYGHGRTHSHDHGHSAHSHAH